MVLIAAIVAQERRGVILVVDDDVEVAVVINIGKSDAASRAPELESWSCDRRDVFKRAVARVVIEQVALSVGGLGVAVGLEFRVHVAGGDENVRPAVVIVVEKAAAKGPGRRRRS